MKEMPSNQTSRTAVCQAGATLELGDSEGGAAESELVELMMMRALLFLIVSKKARNLRLENEEARKGRGSPRSGFDLSSAGRSQRRKTEKCHAKRRRIFEQELTEARESFSLSSV